jgi:hypothetical protein
MRIVEIEQTDLNRDYAGFYVTDSDTDPSEWTWNDRGNGPEIIDPLAYGPFPSESAAQAWIDNS